MVAQSTFEAEQSLAELVSRAYGVYRAALAIVPRVVRGGDQDEKRYLTALSDAGATFAPDLAMAARFSGVDGEPERLPHSLPRLVRVLEDGFAVFSGVHDASDLKSVADVLPSEAEVEALFDAPVADWVAARGVSVRKA